MLLGRVPAERHEHYDRDGELTGFTLVIREPEWTDDDVRDLLEQAQVDAEACPGCGWHEVVADDESLTFGPVERKCPVCAGQAQYDRLLAQQDDAASDGPPTAPRPADGRWVHMAVLSPDEIEKRGGSVGNQG